MTLVAGGIIGNKVRIESDTKITSITAVALKGYGLKLERDKQNIEVCNFLKSVIVNPYLYISYAGETYYSIFFITPSAWYDIDFKL